MMRSSPAEETAPTERDEQGRRIWRNGTLVYTAGGLVALCALLVLGDFAWQLRERSLATTAQLFLRTFHASDFLVGLLVGSIPAAVGMLLGPVIAVHSDRHRGRWGRRIPYLLVPLPFVIGSMAGLAFSVAIGGWVDGMLAGASPGRNTCILASFALFWGCFEVFAMTANIVFGALVNDVVPHALLGRFFALFRIVSLVDAMLFGTFLIGYAETHYSWIFIGTGLFYGLGFLLMCLFVKEGEYPPPAPRPAGPKAGKLLSVRAYFRECFATPFYLWIFVGTTFSMLAFGPFNSFSLFYSKSLGIGLLTYGRYGTIASAISLALAYFVGALADKFHPLRMGIGAMTMHVAICAFGAIFGNSIAVFGVAFVGHSVMSGLYYTSMASVGQRLYPRMKFAQFASAAFLLHATLNSLMPPLVGLILDASGHNYRLTFIMGGGLGAIGLAGLIGTYRQFMRLGGPLHYHPPGEKPGNPLNPVEEIN